MTASSVNEVVLSKNNLQVTIATMMDEENLTKSLILITPPKSTNNQETDPDSADYGPNDTIIIDILNKAERRITIDGELVTGMSATDTHNDAEGKKSDLKKIFLGGGVIDMTYESTTFEVNIDKLSIKRQLTDGILAPDGVTGFSVKFTCIRGGDFA